jgi:hypothetical protein
VHDDASAEGWSSDLASESSLHGGLDELPADPAATPLVRHIDVDQHRTGERIKVCHSLRRQVQAMDLRDRA